MLTVSKIGSFTVRIVKPISFEGATPQAKPVNEFPLYEFHNVAVIVYDHAPESIFLIRNINSCAAEQEIAGIFPARYTIITENQYGQ